MLKKILLVVMMMSLAVFIFAGGQKEKPAEPTPAEAEEMAAEAEEGPKGTGIPYKPPINIGTKNFTEQFVVGNLMAILLEDRGFDVELKTGMASTVLREAMENGDIDLCMDYTGTMWLSYTGHEFKGESPNDMFRKTRESDAQRGLVWMDPIWCNNTYAIAVTKQFSEKNGVKTLSDFAEYVKSKEGDVPIASTFEFYSRPDGILGMQVHYDFAFKPDTITTVLPGLTHEQLVQGRVEATTVFGTDAPVVKYDWVVLQDDKYFWPPYDLAPYVRKEVLDANPGLADALKELVNAFPKEPAASRLEMTRLNAKVDIDLMEPEDAAEEWLKKKGLID
ncbi:MAG: glycine/betaine ABC transporter substrate-binding protein [Spirochaetes bacterium]|nr:glycine/betaine ABC transporter substrate-binding protein [Spirochaetota bacterium]